jgi:hypothetical protein
MYSMLFMARVLNECPKITPWWYETDILNDVLGMYAAGGEL